MERLQELRRQRLLKLQEVKDLNVNPYPYSYTVTNYVQDLVQKHASLLPGQENRDVEVSLAGRLSALREHGKSKFGNLQDSSGKIQIYLRQDIVGEENFNFFKKLDIGDILGVKGGVFRTHTGELTILVREFKLLTKSLRPLPEKWHGLTDVEQRYRQRYLDLICNPAVRKVFEQRIKIIKSIREFLDHKGFLEVETPMMHSIPGGATARPFVTYHNTLDCKLYLRIAPELYLKRLLVGGFDKVYELNRNFRNEGISIQHNPEFTMLEIYQAYVNYEAMMELVEEIFFHLGKEIIGTTQIDYQGVLIDLTPPWPRLTMVEALQKYGGINVEQTSDEELGELTIKYEIPLPGNPSRGEMINVLFDKLITSKLIQPVFIKDYPVETSPLAKRKPNSPQWAERFESFIYGREMGNAFSELNDPVDQRERFKNQISELGKEGVGIDEDFLRALEYGMPPAAGLGLGIDRLVMLLTNAASIREVIFFPQLRDKSVELEEKEEIITDQ